MNTIAIPKAVTLVKPFVAKSVTRPVLNYPLVAEKHVIATDSHRMIRIRHYDHIEEPYLHDFNGEEVPYSYTNYPKGLERLIPDTRDAKNYWTDLNVKMFLELHEELKPFTSKTKNRIVTLDNALLKVEDCADPTLDEMPVNIARSLPFNTDMFMRYNCLYMIEALKVFKKAKKEKVQLYYYGRNKPFLLTDLDDIEIIILPIRS